MPTILTAINCPLPITNTALNTLADAKNAAGLNGAQVLYPLVQGSTDICEEYNSNIMAQELIGRKGCGTYCILTGLAISIGSALLLNVSAGQAFIDSVVEIPANTTIAVPDSTARVYIWLKQDGSLTYVANSITPPTGGKVFLGSCVTSGGVVTSVDTSGVLTSQGAIAIRTTADATVPTDTPPSTLTFLTKTTLGTYMWNGSAYTLLFTSSEFTERVQDDIAAFLQSGTGITWTYNDASNTLTPVLNLTAFSTTNLPEGTNLYYTDARVKTYIESTQIQEAVNVETLTATKTLVLTDKNVQALTASGASRDCRLPSNTSLSFGHWFKISNVGGSNNIVVKTNDGVTTLVTLTPGQYCMVNPTTNSGTPNWPNSATAVGMGTPA